ncbi:MAG: hypothetical protein J6N70_03015, partial [Oribacterium sp.]|nr:hypothetical protein [Oribacterium sp.]
ICEAIFFSGAIVGKSRRGASRRIKYLISGDIPRHTPWEFFYSAFSACSAQTKVWQDPKAQRINLGTEVIQSL